ncbi:hypothetical protein NKDENANG_00934 [Candidatus Entotheonellaceae bacterium PAL068K]
MSLTLKQFIIGVLGILFLVSLVVVQWLEVTRKQAEAGLRGPQIAVPTTSKDCVECHAKTNPGIVAHWQGSTHAEKGVACVDCHAATRQDADAFGHYGAHIATVVTPRDCSRCHLIEAQEFAQSHHAKGGNILASLDNFLAETVEGSRVAFNPHSPTPGRAVTQVNGLASAFSGCQQCHGSKVALQSTDGGMITVDDLQPDENGIPTNLDAVGNIVRNDDRRPLFHPETWPNTGIGRLNLDGSLGSCTACHSRHDFSPRRARQPENCGKCHLGPDHPQKEIYEESKHGIAYRDLRDAMNLDAASWILGKDYAAAPTCATCHMSGHLRNGGKITHDVGERISWNNRPPVSLVMDTDITNEIVKVKDPDKRRTLIHDSWEQKRNRMKQVCSHCHTPDYINAFYTQYDNLVILYNEKFGKAGQKIMAALGHHGLISKTQFDDEIEWTWFLLWHHEGRRARHGAAMMAPDYTHWHGMYEVADRFYMKLIPQARELTAEASRQGRTAAAEAVKQVVDAILARPEHQWFKDGAEEQAERVRREMERRYGQDGHGS